MNVTKRVYVLMLSLIIVLSGCLGGTTDGQDEDDGGDTIINNYWNNTTIQESPEMIAIGGVVYSEATTTTVYTEATINTTAGEMLQIMEIRIYSDGYSYLIFEIDCDNDASFNLQGVNTQDDTLEESHIGNLPGSTSNCTHLVKIVDGYSVAQTISWSLVYSIHPVTVG